MKESLMIHLVMADKFVCSIIIPGSGSKVREPKLKEKGEWVDPDSSKFKKDYSGCLFVLGDSETEAREKASKLLEDYCYVLKKFIKKHEL